MFLKKYVKHAWAVLWQSQIKHGLANHLAIWLASLIQPNLAEGMFGFARQLGYISLELSLQLCLTCPPRVCFKFGEDWIHIC